MKKFLFALCLIPVLLWSAGCNSSGKKALAKIGLKIPSADRCEVKLEKNQVIIQSNRLKMVMEGGIVTCLDDLETGESFVKRTADSATADRSFQKDALLPESASDIPTIRNISKNEAVVTYVLKSGPTLIYEIKTEGDDILIHQRMKGYDLSVKENRKSLQLPIPSMVPDAVITGMGSKTLRNDPKRNENLLWYGSGFYFPRVLMAEGKESTLMFFCESTLPYHNIVFNHTPENDQVVLCSAVNGFVKMMGRHRQFPQGELDCFTWRISAHDNWLEAAKAWRPHFERYSGAVPLWKNPAETARNTHAYYTGSGDEKFYRELAKMYRPDGIVLLYWNDDSFVLLGDSTYRKNPFPSLASVAALRKCGFKWMGFHGYTLLWSCEKTAQGRLDELKRRKLLPENYTFKPDWQGKPEDFLPTMSKLGYGRPKQVWSRVAPGSKIVQDYLTYAIQYRAKLHDMDGYYLDITGAMTSLTDDIKVVDGMTYVDGDIAVFSRLRKEAPHLVFMTEYAGEWVIPYAFWNWDGFLAMGHKNVRINHPLRAALYGSYVWAREATGNNQDPVKCEYYGTLPEIVWGVGNDSRITDKWYNERAKLFVENKLFHDLPEEWDDDAVAYYRGDGTDNWVVFRKTPYGYAFEKDGQAKLGIYRNMTRGIPGGVIPHWLAYDRKGRAIGLNPAREYRFISEKEARPLTVTGLPDGVYCSAVCNSKFETSVHFASETAKEADVSVAFDGEKKPLRVYVNGEEQKSGLTSFRMTLPGIVTAIWEEGKPANLGQPIFKPTPLHFFRQSFCSAGKLDVNGLQGTYGYRGWAYNMHDNINVLSANKVAKNTVGLSSGRFQSFMDFYVEVPKDKSILKFDVAMLLQLKKLQMEAKIRINGKEVWCKDIPYTPEWMPEQVDLSAYAGQTVLVTLEYKHKSADVERGIMMARGNMIYFGDLRFAGAEKK